MNPNKTLLAAATCCAVLAVAKLAAPVLGRTASGRQGSEALYDTIDTCVQGQMARLNLPGAALALVEGDEITHLRTFGKALIEHGLDVEVLPMSVVEDLEQYRAGVAQYIREDGVAICRRITQGVAERVRNILTETQTGAFI